MNTKADILMKLFCSNNKSTKTKEYIFNNNSFCLVAYTQTHTHTHTHPHKPSDKTALYYAHGTLYR